MNHIWPSCSKSISIDVSWCFLFNIYSILGVENIDLLCTIWKTVLIQVIYIQYINLFLYQLLWSTQSTLVIAHSTWVICDCIVFSMWLTMSPKRQLIGKKRYKSYISNLIKVLNFFWHNPFIFKNLRPISSGFTNQPHSRSYAYPLGIVDKFIIISRCVW